MMNFFKKNIEAKKKLRIAEIVLSVVLGIASLLSIGYGLWEINAKVETAKYIQSVEMIRDVDLEDYSEDNTICEVT